jgi:PAS domain S-box-containing protein
MTQNQALDLLLLTTNLSQLKDRDRITTLFIEGMNAIFPGLVFSWTDHREPRVDDSRIEVCTRKETYGFITCFGKVPPEEDTWALIHNAGQMLGVILEKSRQEQLLVEQNKRLEVLAEEQAQMASKLEIRVAERTADLEKANKALANSRLAALNVMADAIETRKHAEKSALALRESEEHFRTMAEELTDVLFTSDAQGLITYISPASSQVFGWPPEEMQGHPFTDFLPETEIPKAMAKFQLTTQTGAPTRSLNLLMKRKGDNTFHLEKRTGYWHFGFDSGHHRAPRGGGKITGQPEQTGGRAGSSQNWVLESRFAHF